LIFNKDIGEVREERGNENKSITTYPDAVKN
jgi:hypothetical protein